MLAESKIRNRLQNQNAVPRISRNLGPLRKQDSEKRVPQIPPMKTFGIVSARRAAFCEANQKLTPLPEKPILLVQVSRVVRGPPEACPPKIINRQQSIPGLHTLTYPKRGFSRKKGPPNGCLFLSWESTLSNPALKLLTVSALLDSCISRSTSNLSTAF